MGQDYIWYDIFVQDVLCGVICKVFGEVVVINSLFGDYYFFIIFLIGVLGVCLLQYLKSKYLEQMIIVVQYQFWDFKVMDVGFEIGFFFFDMLEKLVILFNVICGFYDFLVNFEFEFDVVVDVGMEIVEDEDVVVFVILVEIIGDVVVKFVDGEKVGVFVVLLDVFCKKQ